METFDDKIANLEKFIAALISSHGAVEQLNAHFEDKTRSFSGLEGQAAQEGDGLNNHLEEAESALQGGEQDAASALRDLTQAATEGEHALDEAKDLVAKAASDVEAKAQAVATGLEGAHATLTEQGFVALDHALEAAQKELQAEDGHCTETLAAFTAAAQARDGESHAAWDAAHGEYEHATADLERAATEVAGARTDTEHGFEAAETEAASQCTSLEGELVQMYHALLSGVEAEGHEWDQHVQQATQDATSFLHDGEEQRLAQPARLLHDEPMAGLTHEYEALSHLLEASTSLVAEVPPLSEDLVKAEYVVSTVDRLIQALV
jgi:chromosome segregation ATPase